MGTPKITGLDASALNTCPYILRAMKAYSGIP